MIVPVPALVTLGMQLARFDAPVRPDREQAKSWAREELARREYQTERPGLIEMLLDWISRQLDRVQAPGIVPGNIGVSVAIVLVLAVAAFIVWRTGGLRRQAKLRTPGIVFETVGVSAADHRRAAEEAEAGGDLRTALLERFRAIARSLADRALIAESPGLTADELARRAGSRLPALADDLSAAATSFDEVRYGDRPATIAAVRAMSDLDTRAAAATPAPAGNSAAGSLAVPR